MKHHLQRVGLGVWGSVWVLGALAFPGCGAEADELRLVEPPRQDQVDLPAAESEDPGAPSEGDGADPGVISPGMDAPAALDCARERPLCEPGSSIACTLSCEARADGCVVFSEFVPLGVVPGGYGLWFDAVDPGGRYVYFSYQWSGGRWEAHPYSWTAAGGVAALGEKFGLLEDPEDIVDRFVSIRQVSPGGNWVLGLNIIDDSAETGFLWSLAQGVTPLGLEPVSMSLDGSVVLGLQNSRAVIWQRDAGMRRLDGGDIDAAPSFPSDQGLMLSDSGEFAIFTNGAGTTFRWSEASGLTDVRELFGAPAASPYSLTMAASGHVIFGSFGEGQNELTEAFRWSESTGVRSLGELAGMAEGLGYAPRLVTSDGRVVVGTARSPDGSEQTVFRWTEATGIQPISATASNSQPIYLSPDGDTVIGYNYGETALSSFRWNEQSGLASIEGNVSGGIAQQGDLLVQRTLDGGLTLRKFGSGLEGAGGAWIDLLPSRPVPEGWSGAYLQEISDDGRLLLGSASDPQGGRQGWLVRLSQACPELQLGGDSGQ